MSYQIAIFDLDGTILDTLEDLKESLNAALASEGLPPRTLEQTRAFVGNGIQNLIARAVPDGTAPEKTARVYDAFNRHYAVHCQDHTRPYAGIPEALLQLRQAGVRTAVVSNKSDYAVQTLCGACFPGQFDAALGWREGLRKKPAPDSVLAVLQECGIAPSEAVYIGDSDVDIETARNAGLACIAVNWGFRPRALLEQVGAQTIVSDVPALLRAILREEGRVPLER